MNATLFFLLSLLCSIFLPIAPALAHEGEDHGVTPAQVGQLLEPRFEARGDAVEITGVLHDGKLWLFAAHVASSAPWSKLKIEIEGAGETVPASETAQGVYRAAMPRLAEPGRHALTLIVQGQRLNELLTAELRSSAAASPASRPYAWIFGGVAVAVVVAVLLYRRFSRSRRPHA